MVKEGNRRQPPACDNGSSPSSVSPRGLGRVQRRIWYAFLTYPDSELSTVQLAAWAYPRLEEGNRNHWRAIRRAAERVATRVHRGRVVVWRAFGSFPSKSA